MGAGLASVPNILTRTHRRWGRSAVVALAVVGAVAVAIAIGVAALAALATAMTQTSVQLVWVTATNPPKRVCVCACVPVCVYANLYIKKAAPAKDRAKDQEQGLVTVASRAPDQGPV